MTNTEVDGAEFGRRLAEARRGRGLTQRELARKAYMAASHLCAIEKGARACGPAMAFKLATALKIEKGKEYTLIFGPAKQTVTPRRRRTMARLQFRLLLETLGKEIQRAGIDPERIMGIFSAVGKLEPGVCSQKQVVLDDGRCVAVTIKISE